MKKNAIKPNDMAFGAQLLTCKTNLPTYAAVLKITPEEVASQAADALAFNYWLGCNAIMHRDAQQFTKWKDLMRDGGAVGMATEPGLPVLPTSVPPVDPGIEARHRAFIQTCYNKPGYNDAIGAALDILGVEITPPDLTQVMPLLTLSINGNRVFIGWGWQNYQAYLDQLEMQVDRNDAKGFVLLTYCTTPGFTDPTPFPAVPTKWTYRAIFRLNNAQVGQYSSPVSIMVGV